MKHDDESSIDIAENGPYVVKKLSTLTGADGAAIPAKPTVALCRCGETGNRPFCDGTHARVGFTGDKSGERVPDRRESYAGKQITIHDNRGICSHAGHCTDNLPSVFRSGEPWIDPDGADAAEIIRVIEMCPSGALSYTVDDVEHRDLEREPAIRITPHGPYRVEGGISLNGAEPLEGTSIEHRTLCRCGHSKNKPFCDGAHWYANFRDDSKYRVAMFGELKNEQPVAAEVEGVEVVVVRVGDEVRVFEGRCKHEGEALAEGEVEDSRLVCDYHRWSYDLETGQEEDDPACQLHRFSASIDERWGEVTVDLDEIRAFKAPEQVVASAAEVVPAGGTREEPHNAYIHALAEHGLAEGSHGPVAAMGVPRYELPTWDDLQFVTAQLHKVPLMDDAPVGTDLVIGPRAAKPLQLEIPIFVSDMSFGALSLEAKVALARGAELAGTGICSGEGGMLPEEQAANSRYFYELASARFGFSFEQLDKVQAFHFKCGQAAKTGTGGHLPGEKVTEKIAVVRGLKAGEPAISPARFPEWESADDFRRFAGEVRERTGGIPVGFKLSAQHVEADLDAALTAGADYVILDGRGGGTGAAPLIFRDHISVPALAALPRARRHLDENGHGDVTLIITGGLRTPADFAKALALGADGIAISNSALQAIGCVAARACNTNTCPAGIATQDEDLRKLLDPDSAAENLTRFLRASVQLMSVLARACGRDHLRRLSSADLTTWKRDVAYLTGVRYAGIVPL